MKDGRVRDCSASFFLYRLSQYFRYSGRTKVDSFNTGLFARNQYTVDVVSRFTLCQHGTARNALYRRLWRWQQSSVRAFLLPCSQLQSQCRSPSLSHPLCRLVLIFFFSFLIASLQLGCRCLNNTTNMSLKRINKVRIEREFAISTQLSASSCSRNATALASHCSWLWIEWLYRNWSIWERIRRRIVPLVLSVTICSIGKLLSWDRKTLRTLEEFSFLTFTFLQIIHSR